MSEFHTRGVIPVDSHAYVHRDFENTLAREIAKKNWVLLLGPRQHGKSSCLLRLKLKIREEGIACARVDLQSMGVQSDYPSLLRNISKLAAREYGTVLDGQPVDVDDLEAWLELCAPKTGRVILFIDEAAAIRSDFRNIFYSQLRSIANGGSDGRTIASRLVCVFSGTFVPQLLVEDSNNSPFNVCTFIYTDDLTFDQACALFSTVITPVDVELVKNVYDLVGGQPYLLQRIFEDLSQVTTEQRLAEFANVAAQLKRGDDDGHATNLFKQVLNSAPLTAVLSKILADGFVSDAPADLDLQFIVTIGIAAKNAAQVKFRNALYREIALLSPQFSLGNAQHGLGVERARMFTRDVSAFVFIPNMNLREVVWCAYNSGVNSYVSGDFRLALVAFGSALEGILIAWLSHIKPADLAVAVQSAKSAAAGHKSSFKNFEIETDPATWNLVNMIRVTRQSIAGRQINEPNDALREWRNLVHPKLILNNYYENSLLEPEARQANAMLDVVLRDIGANML